MAYCADHGRQECQAATPKGTCHRKSGGGPCWQHKGELAVPRRTAKVGPFSVDLDGGAVTPRESAILMLQVSWKRWQEYARLLDEQIAGSSGGAPVMAADGLVAHRYGASSAAGGIYPTSEAVRSLVELEAAERDRCAKLAKMAHDMGISDEEWT